MPHRRPPASPARQAPWPPHRRRWRAGRAADQAEAAGLVVQDLRTAALEMKFYDIAAVIVFLRKVIWTVPGFTIERYRPQLAELHHRLQAEGSFTPHSQRFLIE